jgi:hypothetical protein
MAFHTRDAPAVKVLPYHRCPAGIWEFAGDQGNLISDSDQGHMPAGDPPGSLVLYIVEYICNYVCFYQNGIIKCRDEGTDNKHIHENIQLSKSRLPIYTSSPLNDK